MNSQLLNNSLVFSQKSNCELVNGDVTLLVNTWEQHIKVRHPEVSDSLQHIQGTIENPAYVADSLPGPNQTHAGNLVFVSIDAKIRSSHLHVFVESPTTRPTISTAIYAKRRHANVIWRNPRDDVRTSYDQEADVLYISKEAPVPALTEEGDDGLLLRYAIEDDKPCGVTVVAFRKLWAQHETDMANLVGKVAAFLGVSRDATEKALTSLN